MSDLDAYLARIGHTGTVAADLPTLRTIVLRHAVTIPFENLDPFSGRPVLLDAAALWAKLVDGGRGGYCFEHNRLLQAALDEIGFVTSGLQARVVWGRPDDSVITPRSHKVLRVEFDGTTYLVDVGFGGATLTAPIRLEPDTVQATPHGSFRLLADTDGFWRQQIQVRDEWRTTYRFDLTRSYPIDDVPANWYVSTSPDSHFVTGLTAARPTEDGNRINVSGRDVAVHAPDGTTSRRTAETVEELCEILSDGLLIRLPEDIETSLKRLF